MKILLVCAGGMSTSLIVEAMRKESAEEKIGGEIEAVSLTALPGLMEQCSCVLVAPQVRHRLEGVRELGKKFDVPVGLIDPAAYGRIDGKTILNQALNLTRHP